MAKEERRKLEVTSYSGTKTKTSPMATPSICEENNSFSLGNFVGQENRSTGVYNIAHWYGYGPQDDTVEPVEHIPHQFQKLYCKTLQKLQHKLKFTRQKRKRNGKRVTMKKDSKRNKESKKCLNHNHTKLAQTTLSDETVRVTNDTLPSESSTNHSSPKVWQGWKQ